MLTPLKSGRRMSLGLFLQRIQVRAGAKQALTGDGAAATETTR